MENRFIQEDPEEIISDEDIVIDEKFAVTHTPEYRLKLEKEFQQWVKDNENISPIDISESQVKELLLKDLAFVSKMGVEEYTLYRKWDEIKRKYPCDEDGAKKSGHFFALKDTSPYSRELDQIKNNIWRPKKLGDFDNLRPVIISAQNDAELTNLWNTLRTFTHTQINNSNIGRNLYFIVKDEVTDMFLGIFALSSDFMDLTPRDSYIGWSREIKTEKRMINHTSICSTICPTQPLGFNYVGGKLIALMAISDVAEKAWNGQYGDRIAGFTTTSLYSSYSQYQNLSYWTKRGHSSGSIKFEPTKETLEIVKQYLKKTWPRKYWEWYLATEPQGMPLKRDFKQRSLAFLYAQLKIEKSYFETNHQRGIYFCPLYTNTCEYLRQEITEDKLIKRFDNSVESLVKIWKEKYATKRLKSLIDGKRLNPDTLFYGDVVTMTWEQTKVKYLKEVGR